MLFKCWDSCMKKEIKNSLRLGAERWKIKKIVLTSGGQYTLFLVIDLLKPITYIKINTKMEVRCGLY